MFDKAKIDELTSNLKQFVKTNIKLAKLEATERATTIAPNVIALSIIALVLYLVLLFLSIGLSLYLSELLESTYGGFLIMGGFYLLVGIIFILGRKKILRNPIRDLIIKSIFRNY
ncbi:phage holin family protein [Marivirga sp. S37H4]|uniref:Phage holin family protein n=1 Tax=Marivirga aurantiaca TaxID=2802615 RepID=A0A934WWL9_9BACT|nr:phage holin family protein [Marivirga aurantiaca]MBK6264276.1 phage holin family protein [Marivirga aurantiaca]